MSFQRKLSRKKKTLYMSGELDTKPTPCPNCGAVLNGTRSMRLESERPPTISPGAFTVCCECGQILRYGWSLELVLSSEAEARSMLDPTVVQALVSTRRAILETRPS